MNWTSENKTTNLTTDNNPSGCEMVRALWDVALKCETGKTGGRDVTFVNSRDIEKCFNIATLKCWEERTRNTDASYPPLIK